MTSRPPFRATGFNLTIALRHVGLILLIALLPAAQAARADWPEVGPDDLRVSFTGDDANESFQAGLPRAALNPGAGEFLVVWSAVTVWGGTQTRTEIFGQRVSAKDGERVGAVVAISVPDAGTTSYISDMPDVVYNPVDDRYLVVWHRGETGSEFRALARFVDGETAQPLGAGNLTLFSRGNNNGNNIFDEDRLRLAYSPTAGRYYLVWTATPAPSSADTAISRVYGVSLGSDGQVILPQTEFTANLGLGFPAAADTSPSVVYNAATDEFLVTWLGLSYWYLYDRDDARVFAQRVSATGTALGAPLLVSDPTVPKGTTRAMHPDVIYVPDNDKYLLTWVGTDSFSGSLGVLYLRWLPTDLDNRLPAPFSARPPTQACVGTQPGLTFAPGDGRALLTWSTGDGSSTSSGYCPGGAQIFGLRIGVDQVAGFDSPTQLSQMGPSGGTVYRAFRPVALSAPGRSRALVAWYGNDERPGLASGKREIYSQMVDLATRILLPVVQNAHRPPFVVREAEPNNSSAEANGPLGSGVAVTGYADDTNDYYRLTVSTAGTLSAAIDQPQGLGTQLQLYREPVSLGTLVQSDTVAPYALSAAVTPGVYYVRIYTVGGFTTTAPYTLRVTFP